MNGFVPEQREFLKWYELVDTTSKLQKKEHLSID